MALVLEAVKRITSEDPPITIRHLFYRVEGERLIEKTEAEYTNLCSLLARWRKAGVLNYDVFTDATRYVRGPRLFDDMDEALANTVECYRKNLWQSQPYYVECWCEKDAIASIIGQEAAKFGVDTFPCRGFASLSSLNNAARTFRNAQNAGKEVRVLYFGDHDPSGRLIDKVAQRTLAEEFDVEVEFKRVAVTPEQIESLNLPTRPVKESSHAKDWEGGCVEIDTIRSADLRGMVEREITNLIDAHEWTTLQKVEGEERATLERIWKRRAA